MLSFIPFQVSKMIASFIGGNEEFSRQYLAGDIQLEYVPQVNDCSPVFFPFFLQIFEEISKNDNH